MMRLVKSARPTSGITPHDLKCIDTKKLTGAHNATSDDPPADAALPWLAIFVAGAVFLLIGLLQIALFAQYE